jgi:hypothetical protein
MCRPTNDRAPFVSTFTGTRVSTETLARFAPRFVAAGFAPCTHPSIFVRNDGMSIFIGECLAKITRDDVDVWACFSEEQVAAFLETGALPINA